MSLETPDGVLDPAHADDPNPTTVVAGRPAPEAPVAPEFKVSEDQNIVETGGRKYVREEALHQERQARQKLSDTLNRMEPLMGEFEEFLANKAAGGRATVARATVPAADDNEYSPDELEGLAIVRGYYTQDNKPDLKRAKSELDLMARVADRRAERAVDPVRETTTRDRAAANHATARERQFVDGQPVADKSYVDAAFQSLPEEYRADPLIANITSVIAAGLEYLDMRKQGKIQRGRREPVLREGGSGRVDRISESLDDLDRAAARARGKTPEQWSKLSKQADGGTVLEEV